MDKPHIDRLYEAVNQLRYRPRTPTRQIVSDVLDWLKHEDTLKYLDDEVLGFEAQAEWANGIDAIKERVTK